MTRNEISPRSSRDREVGSSVVMQACSSGSGIDLTIIDDGQQPLKVTQKFFLDSQSQYHCALRLVM